MSWTRAEGGSGRLARSRRNAQLIRIDSNSSFSLGFVACDSLARSANGYGCHRPDPAAGGGVFAWLKYRVQEGESIESALRRFKRKVQQEDIIKDIKKHSFYLKPGDKRRAKQALARKRNRKKMRRELE